MSQLAKSGIFSRLLGSASDTIPGTGTVEPPSFTSTALPTLARDKAVFVAPAAAKDLPAGAVPYAKGAGYHVPPGTANGPVEASDERLGAEDPSSLASNPSSLIPVKAHGRKPSQPITLEVVLEQFRLFELRPLTIGKFCVQWLRHQPELAAEEQLPRGEALRRIRQGLVQRDQVSMAARLDRYIACYFVALALGWDDGWKLRYAAIRELMPLFGRNAATEEYVLRPERERATRGLWARMVAERLTAETVRGEVRKIRPPKSFRLHGRSGRLATIRRDLQRLKAPEDLLEVIRLAQERLARLAPASERAVA